MKAWVMTRREVALLITAVLIAVLVALLGYMVISIQDASAVTYEASVVIPEKSDLCYGEALIYTSTMVVHRAPVILKVVENYCEPGPQGLCFRSTGSSYELGVSETKSVTAVVSRVIPSVSVLKPGEEYVFSHVAEDGLTVGYQVPFRMRKDCSLP